MKLGTMDAELDFTCPLCILIFYCISDEGHGLLHFLILITSGELVIIAEARRAVMMKFRFWDKT